MQYALFTLALSSKILQIELPKIDIVDLKNDSSHFIRAYVNQYEKTIYCEKNWVDRVDYPELIGVLSHECRHLYQFHQIALFQEGKNSEIDQTIHDQWVLELMRKSSISNEIKDDFRWEIEADAEAYSAAIMRYCFQVEVQIIPALKNIVEAKIIEFELQYHLSNYRQKKGAF
jgi:hypothetical protein